jgi:hypothetical protein
MTKVTIEQEKTSLYVEMRVDNSTYLLSQEQYAELFHTALQHPPKDVAWLSCVTRDMVAESRVSELVDDLNDYVADTCMMYGSDEEEDE